MADRIADGRAKEYVGRKMRLQVQTGQPDDAGQAIRHPRRPAVVPVAFRVSGAGELAGAGSANPKDVASFRQPRTRTFQGRSLAVLRPTGQAGAIMLNADAEGIGQTSLQVSVREGG